MIEPQGTIKLGITEEQEEIHQQPPQQLADHVIINMEAMIHRNQRGDLLPRCCIYYLAIRKVIVFALILKSLIIIQTLQPLELEDDETLPLMDQDDVMVDIEAIIQQSRDGLLDPDCCISRVPYTLRDIKPNAYAPKYISIGPFHYGEERLQDMERHKQFFLKIFKQRTSTSLEDLVCSVRRLVPKVRASYSENINLSDSELVKLTLRDAAFIIEFFYSFTRGGLLGDAMLLSPALNGTIQVDLALLENQLPFFVIEELFNNALSPLIHSKDLPSFCVLACEFFAQAFDLQKPTQDPCNGSIKHFTNLLRLLFLQRAPKMEPYF
ncbi:UPF0481 protein At3g47200-like [Prosopis cineraria]|uniref:UPF0481 protein At3g47200-like n=1 Tax=Prosopis cineraria TaxID=364024 RepID=UPI00240FE5DA|nr:UPF0481 protein At3g47200-like [Prosopis cineraria]